MWWWRVCGPLFLWVIPSTPSTAPARPPVQVAAQPEEAPEPEDGGALRAVIRSGVTAPGGGRFDASADAD